MRNTLSTWFVGLLLVLAGVAAADEAPKTVEQGGMSATDRALLEHLVELNKELRALRSEVGELRGAVLAISNERGGAVPPGLVTEIELGSNPVLGDPQATVAIVEFSDFQCPFCRRAHDLAFSELRSRYIDTGKIRYVVRDFPLDFHPHSHGAAIAARCAGEQDAYWPMREQLFEAQASLGRQTYTRLAGELGLDGSAFATCLDSRDTALKVSADFDYGASIGVRGTPSFYIGELNGDRIVQAKRLSGARPMESFEVVLRQYLDD